MHTGQGAFLNLPHLLGYAGLSAAFVPPFCDACASRTAIGPSTHAGDRGQPRFDMYLRMALPLTLIVLFAGTAFIAWTWPLD
jgi:hypothetical protein